MKIGQKDLSNPTQQYVIAEIGVNHEGKIENALKLVEMAKAGGADAVKFQTYKAELIAARDAKPYWDPSEENTETQYELFKKYDSFGIDEYSTIYNHCLQIGIDFASTPFDVGAVSWLNEFVPYFKVASADITNFQLLRAVAKTGKPILLSTGASNLIEIKAAVKELEKNGSAEICIMHCILNYPTDFSNANLNMIKGLAKEFPNYILGYSDHTRPDPNMSILTAAVCLGAQVIEKHFTSDKKLNGNDHYHSMDTSDLQKFVANLKLLNKAFGNESKHFLESEIPARENARRSLHYARTVREGESLREEDFISLRPSTGISPDQIDNFVGKKIKVSKLKFDRVEIGHFEF